MCNGHMNLGLSQIKKKSIWTTLKIIKLLSKGNARPEILVLFCLTIVITWMGNIYLLRAHLRHPFTLGTIFCQHLSTAETICYPILHHVFCMD